MIAAVGVALLPKCPACWSAYAGLSSLLGVSFVVEPALLLPLTLASLALALAALWFNARGALWFHARGSQRYMASSARRYAAFAVGLASALLVWGGKFVLSSEPLTWLGLLGLIVASLEARRGGPREVARASELPEHAQAR